MSGAGMPCIIPPRPSGPWHMAHPTPSMPWLFSTTRPAEVVPCRKIRRPLSVWDTGARAPAPTAAKPSRPTVTRAQPIRARMSDYVCHDQLPVKVGSPKLLDVQSQSLEETAIHSAERGICKADPSECEDKGDLRLVGSLDEQKSGPPATTGIHVIQPVVHLRKGPVGLIEEPSYHSIEIERQRYPRLGGIEVRLVRLG